ncbi:MAG: type II toxin-antitoxin system VapC family toxin [Anaerolineales bacterium]
MSIFYLDTSALVKRYVAEPGSAWLESFVMSPANLLFLSEIGVAETAAAFARYARTGQINSDMQAKLYASFLDDCKIRLMLIPVSSLMIITAANLTQKHPLRGYAAVHLACALNLNQQLKGEGLQPLRFLSADTILLKAAAAEGLQTENPSNYL